MYAVTKKTNELMTHVYFHLYKFQVIGLRFFTVYGPWGRPDMSLNIFSQAVVKNQIIPLFNKGKMFRDFTYIDDLTESIFKLVMKILKNNYGKEGKYLIFNIGNSKKISLKKYLNTIFFNFKKKIKVKNLPLQKGDIKQTTSSSKKLKKFINFKPSTTIEKGIRHYVQWFKKYYNV